MRVKHLLAILIPMAIFNSGALADKPFLGPCVIDGYSTGRGGYMDYSVTDGVGRIVLRSTYDYDEAVYVARRAERNGMCQGIVSRVRDPRRRPPPRSYCRVIEGRAGNGQMVFRVVDRVGRIIFTGYNYSQAIQVSRSDQRCFM